MSLKSFIRSSWRYWIYVTIAALLLSSLYSVGMATSSSTQFGRYYLWVLGLNIGALVVLVIVIFMRLIRLRKQLQENQPGSLLTRRLLLVMVSLTMPPLMVLYVFAADFLQEGIDSWFDVRMEQALDDALALGQLYLDVRSIEVLEQTSVVADQLRKIDDINATKILSQGIDQTSASELSLLTAAGKIITSSLLDPRLLPDLPESHVLMGAMFSGQYLSVEPTVDEGLKIRVAIRLENPSLSSDGRILQAIYPLPDRFATLAVRIENEYHSYQNLAYLRQSLKLSFVLVLSMVLLLALLLAVLAAFSASRRLARPIGELAVAAKRIGEREYQVELPQTSADEIGSLIKAFQEMATQLESSDRQTEQAKAQLENERTYLETVLGRLSSGVVTLDHNNSFQTANESACEMLGLNWPNEKSCKLETFISTSPAISALLYAIQQHKDKAVWRFDVTVNDDAGERIWALRAAQLYQDGSLVVVLDELTDLIKAQRDAAWGEVAQRLAHEVKNPLTPIRLAAERLRHKYLKTMPEDQAQVLDRSTKTIVAQVDALKDMVDAFSEFSRNPKLKPKVIEINNLMQSIYELYCLEDGHSFKIDLDGNPFIKIDPGRIRQVIHNLVKNAIEATPDDGEITLRSRILKQHNKTTLEISVADNGIGLPESIKDKLFEPYASTKPKGTGLGLAIVKQIAEEHHGSCFANNKGNGAEVGIRIPLEL